jgi:hypothetical protein
MSCYYAPEDTIKKGNTWAREWRPKDAFGEDMLTGGAGITFKLVVVDERGEALVSFDSANGSPEADIFSLRDTDGAQSTGPYVRATLSPTQTQALDAEPAFVQCTVRLSAAEVYSSEEEPVTIIELAG